MKSWSAGQTQKSAPAASAADIKPLQKASASQSATTELEQAMLTHERLKNVLHYDELSGVFVWIVDSSPRARKTNIAGYVVKTKTMRQYRKIRIDNKMYYAHRLAWLYVNGAWPDHEIDHIDGDGLNNSISNLRSATPSENRCNRGPIANNKTKLKGVCFDKNAKKWKAQIGIGKKKIHLGCFSTPEGAHAAYCKAADKLHGRFAMTHGIKE